MYARSPTVERAYPGWYSDADRRDVAAGHTSNAFSARSITIDAGVLAHGNLWLLCRNGATVEARMDVDPLDSEPLDVLDVGELTAALRALVQEVLVRLAEGHELAERYWAQRTLY